MTKGIILLVFVGLVLPFAVGQDAEKDKPVVTYEDVLKDPDKCKGKKVTWRVALMAIDGNELYAIANPEELDEKKQKIYLVYFPADGSVADILEGGTGYITGTVYKTSKISYSRNTKGGGKLEREEVVPALANPKYVPDKKKK